MWFLKKCSESSSSATVFSNIKAAGENTFRYQIHKPYLICCLATKQIYGNFTLQQIEHYDNKRVSLLFLPSYSIIQLLFTVCIASFNSSDASENTLS